MRARERMAAKGSGRHPLRSLGVVALAMLTFASGCAPGRMAVNASPSSWGGHELQLYTQLNSAYGSKLMRIEGRRWMIAGTTGPLAIHAGAEMLRNGGNAVDAALTTAMSQIVLSGGSWNSFAGILNAVGYDARTGVVWSINGGYDIPQEETDLATIPAAPTPSGRTALVPGFMAAAEAAHTRYGRCRFGDVLEPAIYFADEGFPVDAPLAAMIALRKDVLTRRPDTAAAFRGPSGEWLRAGDVFVQADLAQTLRGVATLGAAYVYNGAWAERLVAAVRSEGGRMTLDDLRRYRPQFDAPLATTFRGVEVFTMPPPEVGGVQLVEAMNAIEASDLPRFGRYADSADGLFRMIQICRMGYFVTYSPAFDPTGRAGGAGRITPADRVTRAAASENWARVQRRGWEMELFAETAGAASQPSSAPSHSDGVVAIDAEGNAIAICHTSNTMLWGTTGIRVEGVSVPDSASFQQAMMARVGPGARLPNATNPVVAMRDGRVALAASCIGSALHECMIQNLVNTLDYGMSPHESAASPMFGSPVFVAADGSSQMMKQSLPAGRFPAPIVAQLRELGQQVEEFTDPRAMGLVQYWVGVQRTADGQLRGGLTPGLNGIAEWE